MSTTSMFRWLSAAIAALVAVGLFLQEHLFAGIACLIAAALLPPTLYRWLSVDSAEVQIVSPLVFVFVAFVVFTVFDTMPLSYDAPYKTTYTPPAVTTTTSAKDLESVYRTPGGNKYHRDAKCGGDNAYSVQYGQAVKDGLQPCKKCAGG